MTQAKLNELIEQQFDICRGLLQAKGKEYVFDEDRLLVFKKAGAIQSETPAQALCGMFAKHVVSIFDMCAEKTNFSDEKWNEKLTDAINYLLLLKGVVWEEKYGQNQSNNPES